ncbi:hypothetical protein GCM10010485_18480 [Streptosporangium carneum]
MPIRGEHHYVIDGATKSHMIGKKPGKNDQIALASLDGEDLHVVHGAAVFPLVGGQFGEPEQDVAALLR